MRPEPGGWYVPLSAAELMDHDYRSVRLKAGSTTVDVTALTPDLFRVGMFPKSRPPRYDSEAIAKHNWEPVAVKMSGREVITLSTEAATARLNLDPLRISFSNLSGRPFAGDDAELGMGIIEKQAADLSPPQLGNPVRLYKRREEGERYFGCGERTSGLEKIGSHQMF